MDRQTLAAYDNDAAAFAKDWHEQPAPGDLHETVKRFFIAGGLTADVGCGSGREVAWLNANGFPAKGFDASEGLLAEARTRYPQFEFVHAELPISKASRRIFTITCCARPSSCTSTARRLRRRSDACSRS